MVASLGNANLLHYFSPEDMTFPYKYRNGNCREPRPSTGYEIKNNPPRKKYSIVAKLTAENQKAKVEITGTL